MSDAPTWEEPFLAALAETGNVTWSAAQAGVDFTTVYRRRNRRPDFASAWAAALAGREAAHRQRVVPPDSPGRRGHPAPAADLVERVSSRCGAQRIRAGAGRWSKGAEDDFLAELAVTANVRRAAAAAGFSPTAVYRRRLKDRRFAQGWDAALAVGRSRLEAYLVETADRTFDPDSFTADAELPRMSVAEAIKVLQLANRATSIASRSGQRGWEAEEAWDEGYDDQMEELRQKIIGKLDRIRKQDDEEKLAAGWTRHGEDWVPPGFAQVEPLPQPNALGTEAAQAGAEEDIGGPRVRIL